VTGDSASPSLAFLLHRDGLGLTEPLVLGEVRVGLGRVFGEIVGVPRAAGPDGVRAVRAAVRLAADRGARVVGIGALAAEAVLACRCLASISGHPILTTGRGYTVAVARHNVLDVLERSGLGPDAHVVVHGGSRSVGAVVARLLALVGTRVTLVRRPDARPREGVAGESLYNAGPGALGDADVVLLMTAAASARLRPAQVKVGAVVVDMAPSAAGGRPGLAAFEQRSVQVVSGGLVNIPGYRTTCPLPISPPTATWATLAETWLLSTLTHPSHALDVPTTDQVLELERLAAARNTTPRPLSLRACSSQAVSLTSC